MATQARGPTCSASYKTIPAGILVEVFMRTLDSNSGRLVLQQVFDEEKDVTSVSLAIVPIVAKYARVPQCTCHLIWEDIQWLYPERPSGFQLLQHFSSVHVSCMVSELPEEEEDLYENGLRDRCFICLDPCEDADMPTARLSREENCHRCHPCWLCTECRIRMSNGKWCCFDCLENDDLESVSNASSASIRRLNLVRPRWCEENSIMPASIVCLQL